MHFPFFIFLEFSSSAVICNNFSFSRRHVKVKQFYLSLFNGGDDDDDDLPDAATFPIRLARN